MKFLGCLLVMLIPSMTWAASFDCAKQHTKIEKLICSNDKLSELDEDLSESYQYALSKTTHFHDLKESQIKWLTDHRNKCADTACVEHTYRERINVLDTKIDCNGPANNFEALACTANNEAKLREVFLNKTSEWRPYVDKRKYSPRDSQKAQEQWSASTEQMFENFTKHCTTFECKRARIADSMERLAFPKEPYDAFLEWVKVKGGQSPLLTSDRWKLASNETQALWGMVDGRIFRLGDEPDWLETSHRTGGSTASVSAPPVPPPFLNRNLTEAEAGQLQQMVEDSFLTAPKGTMVDGIDVGVWRSVFFTNGNSPKCSPNPLYGSITVYDRFPNPPSDESSSYRGQSFNLIEIKPAPIVQSKPTCAMDDPYPDGFFPSPGGTYSSRIEIDNVHGLGMFSNEAFVRPDGTFWLKLSDDNWYRFRRDMSSEAKEIGARYHVIDHDKFEKLRDGSKDITDFDAKLSALFQTPNKSD